MNDKHHLGGVIHTYQKYDPVEFPSPTAPPPDLVSPAFEHLLTYGNMRRLTEEELARAVHLDPSQIKGLGPSLEALMQILEDRRRKILQTYETDTVQHKVYIQDLMTSGQLAERLGEPLVPGKIHVYLCGNPKMIGVPTKDKETGQRTYPKPLGVIEILEKAGFQADNPTVKFHGNIHFEEYW